MTYVTEQTSEELRAHMRRLQAMPGWHNPLDDRLWKEVQTLEAERDQLRAEVQHHIATRERLLLTLTSIHALMYPPPIKTPDGRTMVFRPNDPDPHTILQALSDRIHAIPDQIDRAIEAAKEAK